MILEEGVTSINDEAFINCSNITKVTMQDSVTVIGKSVFYGCENLIEVTLSGNLKSISDEAFYGCRNLSNITLPASLESIGEAAFMGCKSLSNITLPDKLQLIGDAAFYGCNSLTEVTLPVNLALIGNSVFEACSTLKTITAMPEKPPIIGEDVFVSIPTYKIFVPEGTVDQYKQAWRAYKDHIKSKSFLTINGTKSSTYNKDNSNQDFSVNAKNWDKSPIVAIQLLDSTDKPVGKKYSVSMTAVPDNNKEYTGTVSINMGGLDVGIYTIVATAKDSTETITGELTDIEITKATYTNPNKTIGIQNGSVCTGTVTLTDIFGAGMVPKEAKFSTDLTGTTTVMSSVTRTDDSTLSYTSRNNEETTTAKDDYTISITSKNYNDITATISFQARNIKTAVISAVISDKTYDGAEVEKPVTTAVDEEDSSNVTLNYTYKWQKDTRADGTSEPEWSDISTAPKNAGNYKLIINGSNDTHNGEKEITFKINKKDITVKAEDKSILMGETLPTFTVIYTGFVGTENANNAALSTPAVLI